MKENILNKALNSFYIDGFKTHRYESYIKLFAICLLLFMVSCKAKKQLVAKPAKVDSTVKTVDTKALELRLIKAAGIHFNTFSGKARTKLDINGSSNDVTLNIRIKRDEKIWVSITAIAGIEVARALITPDSIMIINRLQSLYIKKPFNYIYKFASKQVNYKTLEVLLVGNAMPELINEQADLQSGNGNVTLTGNLQDLMFKLIIGPDMKVMQTNLSNKDNSQSLQVINNTPIQAGNWSVPSQIDMVSVVNDKKIQANLHYIKIDLDQPLEFPFSIPTRYSEGN